MTLSAFKLQCKINSSHPAKLHIPVSVCGFYMDTFWHSFPRYSPYSLSCFASFPYSHNTFFSCLLMQFWWENNCANCGFGQYHRDWEEEEQCRTDRLWQLYSVSRDSSEPSQFIPENTNLSMSLHYGCLTFLRFIFEGYWAKFHGWIKRPGCFGCRITSDQLLSPVFFCFLYVL